jgi:hypothetical protein
MKEVSMRSLSTTIHESMLLQIGDELANLAGHTNNIIRDAACKGPFSALPSAKGPPRLGKLRTEIRDQKGRCQRPDVAAIDPNRQDKGQLYVSHV